MGRTHSVPRSAKGESRILLIFSVKSFLTTAAGGLFGLLFYLLFSAIGLTVAGMVFIALFGIIGYLLGTVVIPDNKIVGRLRKAGGEQLGEILFRTLTFSRRKKIYLYREGGNK